VGFTEKFPHFDDLNALPDEIIYLELERRALAWLRENRAEVKDRIRKERERVLNALKCRRSHALAPPGRQSFPKPRRLIWRPFRETMDRDKLEGEAKRRGIALSKLYKERLPSLGVRIMRVAGWGCVPQKRFGELSPSRMLVVRCVETEERARAIAGALQERWDALYDYSNLEVRFGCVSAGGFDQTARTKLELRVRDARSTNIRGKAQRGRDISPEVVIHRLVLDEADRLLGRGADVEARQRTIPETPEVDVASSAANKTASARTEGCTSGAGASADNRAKPAEKALGATESVAGNLPFASMQRRLTDLIDELLARLAEEAVNPGFMQLFAPSADAAPVAGLLGFRCPPVEHMVLGRPDPHPLLREHPDWECVKAIRIHDPSELTYAEVVLSANAPVGQTQVTPVELPYPDERKLASMQSLLESWRRAVERRRPEDVHLEDPGDQLNTRSLQMLYFVLAVRNELRRPSDPECDETERPRAREQSDNIPDMVRLFEESARQYEKSHRVVARLAVKRPGNQPEAAPETPTEEKLNVFRFDGDVWEIRFGGNATQHLSGKKGFGIIQKLLQSPNPQRPIPAVNLMGGNPNQPIEGETYQEQLDPEARRRCQERLDEIEAELEEANDRENIPEAERLERERDSIREQLRLGFGLGGKSRPLGPAPADEKARKAVGKNLVRAYGALKRAGLSTLESHLRQAIVVAGTTYAYRPSPEIPWVLQ
jgi:hypothetical protein